MKNKASGPKSAARRRQPEVAKPNAEFGKAHVANEQEQQDIARTCPPSELTWHHLALLAELDPHLAQARWSEVKKQVRDELDNGQRAASAISLIDTPAEQAQFLAIKESITEEWLATNGLEDRLVDMMAHSFSAWLFWMQRYTSRAMLEAQAETRSVNEIGKWRPPSVSATAAMDQAVAMAERFNRIFLRTLRALRDLRRYSSNVTIQSAGQVNIGGQQVNAAQLGAGAAEDSA